MVRGERHVTGHAVWYALIVLIAFATLGAASVSAQPAPVRIMPLGNSITDGAVGSSDDTGYRRSLYLQLTSAGYSVDFVGTQTRGIPTDFDRNHEGHGGWHANQIRDNVYNWLVINPADIVLLHIGTNDISHGDQDPAEVDAILSEIDRYETDFGTPVKVVLAAIISRDGGDHMPTQVFNNGVLQIAQSRIAGGDDIAIVDMYDALLYPSDLADAVHPNDVGYGKMANTWFVTLDSILGSSSWAPNDVGVTDLAVTATSPFELTDDDLLCTYALDGEATTATTSWYRNGTAMADMIYPFEGGDNYAVNDVSGNGVGLTAVRSPVWSATAGYNGTGAYQFTASPYLSAGETFPTGSPYTVTAWINRSADAWNNIICGDVSTGGHVLRCPQANGNLLTAGHDGDWDVVTDGTALSTNTWYFVALTYDESTGEMILYRDGLEVDRGTANPTSDATLQIGAYQSSFEFNGVIDDVRIFSEVLAPDQIYTMYDEGENTIDASQTSVGDQWFARVTSFSDTTQGAAAFSNTITIKSIYLSGVSVSATSPDNYTTDDLVCSYTLEGGATTASVAWLLDGLPIMSIFLPFEGGLTNALTDFSGKAVTVGAVGDPTFLPSGGYDGFGAIELDGNDYIVGGENFPASHSYTKSAWVYPTSSSTNNNIISGDGGSGSHAFWAPTGNGGMLAAGHNGSWFAVEDSVVLPLNTWTFAAVTYDYSTAEIILYKNGVEIDRATLAGAEVDVLDNTLLIGAYGTGNEFTGRIDDARVYNHALSPEQIATLYQTGGTDTLRFTETEIDDEWSAWVTAFSSSEASASVVSNSVTIYPATTTEVTDVQVTAATPNNYTDDDLTCTYTLGGDAVTAATAWEKNGSPIMEVYFPFEGGQTNAQLDYSGNGQSVTLVGDPTWNATGGPDGYGCYDLDGNDWLEAGNNFPTQSSYTKFAWVYRTASGVGNFGNIISGISPSTGSHAFWARSTSGHRLSAGHNGSWFTVEDPDSLDLDTWYCVAVTFDYATNEMILYKNGVEIDRGTPVTPDVTDPSLRIGVFGTVYPWHGSLDEVRVYDYALTPEQIDALYNQGRDVIDHNETAIGDLWSATVTPFSGTSAGTAVASNTLTIEPYAPEVSGVTLAASSPEELVTDDLTVSYTLNAEANAAATAWYVNGSPWISLYLPFEGGAANALTDYSGNAVTVSAVDTPPVWDSTAGHDGSGAMVFDGSGYLAAESFPTASSYTKTAWVYRTDDGGVNSGNIISGDVSSGGHAFWAPSSQGHVLRAGHNGTWSATAPVADNVPLDPDTWYFVAVSFDQDTRLMSLYKDGALIDTGTVAGGDITDATVQVGAYGSNVYPWFGTIDDARVYDFVLSSEQIAAMYNDGQDVIKYTETEVDDVWYADITPFSTSTVGDAVASNSITINALPTVEIDNLLLSSTSGNDFTIDDLEVTFDLVDAATTAATAWYLDGSPLMTAYYPFEGDTASLKDFSGNGAVAIATGDPTWNAAGGFDGNGAYEFDGNDHLLAGEVLPTGASYTKTAWVYRTGTGQNIMSGDTGPAGHAFWTPASNGHRLSSGHNGSWTTVADSDPLDLDTWYFVAVTYDQDTRLMTLYKDGVVIDTGTADPVDVTDATVYIGAFNANHWWIGSIDDARIYNRALSEDQIAALYAAGGENIMKATETDIADVWSAHVTPFSATEQGDTYVSNDLTILEDIEVTNVAVTASSPYDYVTDSLFCSYDLLADAVTAATAWYVDGAPLMTGYYPFEGSATVTEDASGSANDLTVVGTPVFNATGGVDGFGAYDFDGTGWLNNTTSFPTQSSYTKAAWIYRTDDGGVSSGNIISGTSPNTGSHAFWAPSNAGHQLAAGHNGAWTTVQDPDSLDLDTWYHVALTFDYTTGVLRLYKNGVEVDSNLATVSDVTDPVMTIGAYGSVFPWFGSIDDARVYDRALSPEQIAALYTEGQNTIVPEETQENEVWEAYVTPFSAMDKGDLVMSNSVTINPLPVVQLDNLLLAATSPEELTTDDLIVTYDLTFDATTAATAFYKDAQPTMAYFLPMEGGPDNALTDYSGNNVTTTENETMVWSPTSGHDGHGAYQFDGASYLSAATGFPTMSSYTKTAWVYRLDDGGGVQRGNIISGTSPNPGSHAFWASSNNGYRLAAGHDGDWTTVSDVDPLATDTWYFVAVTFDYTTGEMVLYKNGVAVSSATATVSDVTDPVITVGAYGTVYPWEGTIDDPRVYNYALSADQIAAMYTDGNDIIKAAETFQYETWTAHVTPFNDVDAGSTYVSNDVVIQPLAEAQLSLFPDYTIDHCGGTDTIWLQMDYDTVVVTGGQVVVGADGTLLAAVTAIPGPALDSLGAGNYTLSSTSYTDSIVVSFEVLSGQLEVSPDTLFGVVVDCVGETPLTDITIVRSLLTNVAMDPVPHDVLGGTFQVDCTAPTISVFSPPSGGTYTDHPPTLTFRVIDDVDLGYGFYRLDSCAGPWEPLWLFNLVGDDLAIGWSAPDVDPGPHTLYFMMTDEAGNANVDTCTYWWQFNWSPPSCCTSPTGNVNNDPLDNVDLPDIIYLVNYLFLGGSPPACLGEANINGDLNCEVDLPDIIYLVNALFLGGPPPADCIPACDNISEDEDPGMAK
ncbi:hypothetical protein GF420_06895 [candidate division GN15 bacterium]|nr:hypothetical protein [candidate division GN15 bacterium]